MEVLKSRAKAGGRRENDSLGSKGCSMYPTADDPYGPSPCETSSLPLLVVDLRVSITRAAIPNPGQLSAFSEIQYAPDTSAVQLYSPLYSKNTRETFFRLRRKSNGKRGG